MDSCWFFGVEDHCKYDAAHLVGFSRQRSLCFDKVFWSCVHTFAKHRSKHRTSDAQVGFVQSSSTSSAAPAFFDSDGHCKRHDCIRAFDACWFFRIEDHCPNKDTDVGFARQRSLCFDHVFWSCVDTFQRRESKASAS